MSSLPVKPEFGPTLPQLAGPWWRRLPRAARLAAVAVVVLAVVLLVAKKAGGGTNETTVVESAAPAFNFRHGASLKRVAPQQGERVRLEASRDGLFLQSFSVAALAMPAYEGRAAGTYPIVAETLKERLRARFADFELVEEGRARINEVPGYEVVFRARNEENRRLYGRFVMLVPLTDPPTPQRKGVVLELLGTPSAGIPNADQIGDVGQLKLPLRSFRFGTEAP